MVINSVFTFVLWLNLWLYQRQVLCVLFLLFLCILPLAWAFHDAVGCFLRSCSRILCCSSNWGGMIVQVDQLWLLHLFNLSFCIIYLPVHVLTYSTRRRMWVESFSWYFWGGASFHIREDCLPHIAHDGKWTSSFFEDLFNPVVFLLLTFGCKNEPSFCVIPVFFTILPKGGIVTFIIIFTKLLVCDLVWKELVVFRCTSYVVSHRHCVAGYDLCLLYCFFPIRWDLQLGFVKSHHLLKVQRAFSHLFTTSWRIQVEIDCELLLGHFSRPFGFTELKSFLWQVPCGSISFVNATLEEALRL